MKIKIQHINMQGAANTVLRLYSVALNTQITQQKKWTKDLKRHFKKRLSK